MAVESGESCVLLESTDEASDLSDTSPSDSIQQVTAMLFCLLFCTV